MNRRRIIMMTALLLMFGMAFIALAPKAEMSELAAQASAMALIECETGTVLAAQNEELRLPMASTTKIMTALVVLENCDPDETVAIPDEAVGAEGSSVYLKKGESLTVRDLLYGLMLASGNDAAIALAVHVGGSVNGFVDMMNDRAAEMGLTKTHFITPNGLHDPNHLTTALELCLITREAIRNPVLKEIVSSKYHETESGLVPRTFKNKNSLLWTYDGAFGVKTGYTMAAGRCLVFGAERGGMTVVGAVLNCRPMFEVASKLLDHAFAEYNVQTVVDKGTVVARAFIENGENRILEVCPKDSIITVMHRSEARSYGLDVKLKEHLSAPIEAGEVVGELIVTNGAEPAGRTELIAAHPVPERSFHWWWRTLTSIFAA